MYLLTCQGCGTTSIVQCQCPPEMADVPSHVTECPMTDLGASLVCPPGSDCCDGTAHPGLSHDAQANSCTASHEGEACPEPDTCKAWASQNADTRHPAYTGEPPGPCPGGHHHQGLGSCKVCRPIKIEFIGAVTIGRAS